MEAIDPEEARFWAISYTLLRMESSEVLQRKARISCGQNIKRLDRSYKKYNQKIIKVNDNANFTIQIN